MIVLIGSYAELLAKLDKDEQIKYINKAMMRAKKECKRYEERYADTYMALKKLRDVKSEILNSNTVNSHIYPILEEDSDEEIDTTNELK